MCAFSWDSDGVCELKGKTGQHLNFKKNEGLCFFVFDSGRGISYLSEDGALSGTETEGANSLMMGMTDYNLNGVAVSERFWEVSFVVG